MLVMIGLVLLILWAVAFIGFHILGAFIHLLLLLAVIMFLVRIIKGQNPLK